MYNIATFKFFGIFRHNIKMQLKLQVKIKFLKAFWNSDWNRSSKIQRVQNIKNLNELWSKIFFFRLNFFSTQNICFPANLQYFYILWFAIFLYSMIWFNFGKTTLFQKYPCIEYLLKFKFSFVLMVFYIFYHYNPVHFRLL